MVEPTETESKETLDNAIEAFKMLYEKAVNNPESLHSAPLITPIGRPDEVGAARKPRINYYYEG